MTACPNISGGLLLFALLLLFTSRRNSVILPPMNQLNFFGKNLIVFGIVLLVLGAILMLAGKIPFLGRLPGDIYIQKKGFSFYFPVVTCIILSIVLTLILNFFSRR